MVVYFHPCLWKAQLLPGQPYQATTFREKAEDRVYCRPYFIQTFSVTLAFFKGEYEWVKGSRTKRGKINRGTFGKDTPKKKKRAQKEILI